MLTSKSQPLGRPGCDLRVPSCLGCRTAQNEELKTHNFLWAIRPFNYCLMRLLSTSLGCRKNRAVSCFLAVRLSILLGKRSLSRTTSVLRGDLVTYRPAPNNAF